MNHQKNLPFSPAFPSFLSHSLDRCLDFILDKAAQFFPKYKLLGDRLRGIPGIGPSNSVGNDIRRRKEHPLQNDFLPELIKDPTITTTRQVPINDDRQELSQLFTPMEGIKVLGGGKSYKKKTR